MDMGVVGVCIMSPSKDRGGFCLARNSSIPSAPIVVIGVAGLDDAGTEEVAVAVETI